MDCGCKERKELLKAWGKDRRGFFQKAAMGAVAFTLGAKSMKAQQAVAHDAQAILVLRFLNTALAGHREEVGKFVELTELMKGQTVAGLRSGNKHISGEFISTIDVAGPEVIPGWQLIYKTTGDKYSATIKTVGNTSFTFTTNEEAIIETGEPLMVRGGILGRVFAAAFRCIGPIGLPGCCCTYPCCDQCNCSRSRIPGGWNCGCECCVWCETACN